MNGQLRTLIQSVAAPEVEAKAAGAAAGAAAVTAADLNGGTIASTQHLNLVLPDLQT